MPDQAALRLCPHCQAPTSGRFCEGCGHDSALPPPTAASRVGDRSDSAASGAGAWPDPADPTSAGASPDLSQGGARRDPSSSGARPDLSQRGPRPDPADPSLTGARPGGTFDPTVIAAGAIPDSGRTRTWVARIFADRDFYVRVQARKGPDAERVEFPDFYPERRIILRGNQFLIGKRSASQGIVPEIDLGIAPVDIGVSRAHAMIQVDQGGALTITDLGSTNGTSLDGAEKPIPPQQAVALREGSRIHVGGWTTIAITTEP
ncbi:FHA domain-containing protein [Nocardia sp. FBN12]|uniref:FHA domain-containing protein n=1 Tax=Nocardia sp. FBN12 TaxID=3419766 RepID=UPI003D0859BD